MSVLDVVLSVVVVAAVLYVAWTLLQVRCSYCGKRMQWKNHLDHLMKCDKEPINELLRKRGQ